MQAAADPVRASEGLSRLPAATRSDAARVLQAHGGNGSVQRLAAATAVGPPRSADREGGADAALGEPGAASAPGAAGQAVVPDAGGASGVDPPPPSGSGDSAGGAPSGSSAPPGSRATPSGRKNASPPPPPPGREVQGRATGGMRVVQRHPDPPEHPHPHPASTDDASAPLIPYEPADDVIREIDTLDLMFYMVSQLHWDDTGRRLGNPEEIFTPRIAWLMTRNQIVVTDPSGTPLSMTASNDIVPVDAGSAFLVQLTTGRGWELMTRLGAVDQARSGAQTMPLRDHPEITAQDAILAIYMPTVTVSPEEEREIRSRIAGGEVARRRAAGPPAWTRAQAGRVQARVRDRARARAAAAGSPATGSGDAGTGPGAGEHGHGAGSGATSAGPGTTTGHAGTPSTPPAPTPPQQTGADAVHAGVNHHGDPTLTVHADGATTTIPAHSGESDDGALARADAAADALRRDRAGSSSVRLQGGVTQTGFVPPPPGTGNGHPVSADDARQQAEANRGATPGERRTGTGDANTPAYPSSIHSYGMQPAEAPITVRGATNDFTMEIDRGPNADVFAYLQEIHFYWELIRMDRVTPQALATAQQGAGPPGQHVSALSGDWEDIVRTHHNIAEDWHNSSWPEIAAEWSIIGISSAVRSLGSVVAGFFAAMTRPLNEQAIGFDDEGDYILRCVATPIVDRDWLEAHGVPRDRQLIRASSVAVLPIRVESIERRATEGNRGEADQLEAARARLTAARAALAAASTDRARADAQEQVDQCERELALLVSRQAQDEIGHLRSTIEDLDHQRTLLDQLDAAEQMNVPLESRPVELLEFDVGLRIQNISRADYRTQLVASLAMRRQQAETATSWSIGYRRQFRPRVTFASEVTGQTIIMEMVLGEDHDSRQDGGAAHWVLADVSSPSTRQRYDGHSSAAGAQGDVDAIRAAFVNFRENGEYGRGTIAITLPPELTTVVPVSIEPTMRAAPGSAGRASQRLSDLVKAAMIAGLVVSGPAGLAIGAIGGVAGGVVAFDRMVRRAHGDRLHLDWETFGDVLDIVGGVVGVLSGALEVAGSIAREGAAAARAGASVVDLRRAASSFAWVQRIEMAQQGLHIFGLIQNVPAVIMLGHGLIEQLEAIDRDPNLSPGRRRARTALAMAQALQSGVITVITLHQMLSHGMPEVTPDSVVWDRLAEATAPAPSTPPAETTAPPPAASGGSGASAGPSGSIAHGGPDAPARESGGTPTVVGVDPPPVPGEPDTAGGAPSGEHGTTTGDTAGRPADHAGGAGASTVREPGRVADGAGPAVHADAPRPSGEGSHGGGGGMSASGVLAAANRIINGQRSELPPAGRIRYVPEAEFAPLAGPGDHVVGHLDAEGNLLISTERAQAAGLPSRLRALVASRRSQLSGRHLGDRLAEALTARMTADVLVGDPVAAERPLGDALVDPLAGAVGMRALMEGLVHGDLGGIRDALRSRFGNARAEAILAAARADSLSTMTSLLREPGTGFADRYGVASAAVGDLVTSDLGGTPRDRSRLELARALADVVGGADLREAYASGDPSRIDAALEGSLGSSGAQEVRRALQQGRVGDALTALRGAREGPALEGPVPNQPADSEAGARHEAPPAREGATAPSASDSRTTAPGEPAATGEGAGSTPSEPVHGAGPGTAEPARHGQGGPADVPEAARQAVSEFVAALGGPEATLAELSRHVIERIRDFRLLRRLVEGGAIGAPEQRDAVKSAIQDARNRVTNQALDSVRASIERRLPGIEVRLQDLGTPGFGSDRDVTLRAQPREGASPTANQLVEASTEAVGEAYQALRDAGLEPDLMLDTNFYTELHEGEVAPANAGERMAISADQSIVSLTEMRMGMSDAQWRAHQEAQLRSIDHSGAPAAARREMRASMERQFAAADERAARLGRGEAALQTARERLLAALRRAAPPAGAVELRSLMADVKLLEPDAYGTRAAVEGVVYGQQGMARASTEGDRSGAWEHMGPIGREGTLPEQIASRAQQAEAALAHFWSHFPESGVPTPADARSLAKQLGRVSHAFGEAGLSIRSRLVDEAGAVVGAKAETDTDAATMREIRGWAEDSGIRGSDEHILAAWAREASHLATDMSTRLRTSQELARVAHPEGDRGYTPPTPAGPPGTGGGGPGSAGGGSTTLPGAHPGGGPGATEGGPPRPTTTTATPGEGGARATEGAGRRVGPPASGETGASSSAGAGDGSGAPGTAARPVPADAGLGGPAARPAGGAVDTHDPSAQASLHDALARSAFEGDPVWGRYTSAVLASYERAGTVSLHAGAGGTDGVTGSRRVDFLRGIDAGTANPTGAALFREHLRWARASGGDGPAASRGDLIWIDAASGETLADHRHGAVPWPAEPGGGPWHVDHALEPRHGGADSPANYIAVPERMQAAKHAALDDWSSHTLAAAAEPAQATESGGAAPPPSGSGSSSSAEGPSVPATGAPDTGVGHGGPGASGGSGGFGGGGASGRSLRDRLTGRPDVRARFVEAEARFRDDGGQGPSVGEQFDAVVQALEQVGMREEGHRMVESLFAPGQGQAELSPSRFRRALETLRLMVELVHQRPDLTEAHGLAQYQGDVESVARSVTGAYEAGRTLDGHPLPEPRPQHLVDAMNAMNDALGAYRAAPPSDPIARLYALLRLRDTVMRTGETLRVFAPDVESSTTPGATSASGLLSGVPQQDITVTASGQVSEPLARDLPGAGLEEYALTPGDLADLPTQPPGLAGRLYRLLRGWHRAHLVGPGMGAELWEGLMLAPEQVNLQVQNEGVERFIRSAAAAGVDVHVTAVAQGRRLAVPLEGGRVETVDVLAGVTYTITGSVGGGDPVSYRVRITVGAPPAGEVAVVESDIPTGLERPDVAGVETPGTAVLEAFRHPARAGSR